MLSSRVHLTGVVTSVDLEKRDIVIQTDNEKSVVHLWTTLDDNRGAWRSDINWKSAIRCGYIIQLNGYLGNNGRIVCAPQNIEYKDEDDVTNYIQATAYVTDPSTIETETPAGKTVITKIKYQESLSDVICSLVGQKSDLTGYYNNGELYILSIDKHMDLERLSSSIKQAVDASDFLKVTELIRNNSHLF